MRRARRSRHFTPGLSLASFAHASPVSTFRFRQSCINLAGPHHVESNCPPHGHGRTGNLGDGLDSLSVCYLPLTVCTRGAHQTSRAHRFHAWDRRQTNSYRLRVAYTGHVAFLLCWKMEVTVPAVSWLVLHRSMTACVLRQFREVLSAGGRKPKGHCGPWHQSSVLDFGDLKYQTTLETKLKLHILSVSHFTPFRMVSDRIRGVTLGWGWLQPSAVAEHHRTSIILAGLSLY